MLFTETITCFKCTSVAYDSIYWTFLSTSREVDLFQQVHERFTIVGCREAFNLLLGMCIQFYLKWLLFSHMEVSSLPPNHVVMDDHDHDVFPFTMVTYDWGSSRSRFRLTDKSQRPPERRTAGYRRSSCRCSPHLHQSWWARKPARMRPKKKNRQGFLGKSGITR